MSQSSTLREFAHSIRRAAQFRGPRQVYREIVYNQSDDVENRDGEQDDAPRPQTTGENRSQHHESALDTGTHSDESTPLLHNDVSELPLLSTKVSRISKSRIEYLDKRREDSKDENHNVEPTIVRCFERDDGTKAHVIVGQSTFSQTVFNSTNVLIGVGLLGLPLGFAYAGWVIGIISLLAAAALCKYTASLLARCIDVDSSLSNYADIAYIAFGEPGRIISSTLFTIELAGMNVALVILGADTLANLIPSVSVLAWKIIGGVILLPTNFVPLKYLSYASFISCFSLASLIILVVIAGGLKYEALGSLHEVARTYAFPKVWRALPLSFGLIMAPWSGLSVFPSVYRDLKQPAKYNKSLWYCMSITALFNFAFAIIGFLMYGAKATDELTKNVLQTEGYPFALEVMTLVTVVILPLTKFALVNHPIVESFEVLTGIDHRSQNFKPNRIARSRPLRLTFKAFYRVLVTVVIIVIAVAVPSFELVSAVMGAMFAFLICVILPLIFHLRVFWDQISIAWKILDMALIVLSVVVGLCGAIWEFLPKSWINAG